MIYFMKVELIRNGIIDGKEYHGEIIETVIGIFLATIYEVGQQSFFGELIEFQTFIIWDEAVQFIETEWDKRFKK